MMHGLQNIRCKARSFLRAFVLRRIRMATKKTYSIVKEGTELKELRSLASAKKLADEEGAEVFCEGALVYKPGPVENETEQSATVETGKEPDRYRLTARMNVRKGPGKEYEKIEVAEPGTIVEVIGIENDWLHLTDDTYILYERGRFAIRK